MECMNEAFSRMMTPAHASTVSTIWRLMKSHHMQLIGASTSFEKSLSADGQLAYAGPRLFGHDPCV